MGEEMILADAQVFAAVITTAIAILAVILGLTYLGATSATQNLQKDAIEAGAAEWQIDKKTGKREFIWLPSGDEELAELARQAKHVVSKLEKVGDDAKWKDGGETNRVFAWHELEELVEAIPDRYYYPDLYEEKENEEENEDRVSKIAY